MLLSWLYSFNYISVHTAEPASFLHQCQMWKSHFLLLNWCWIPVPQELIGLKPFNSHWHKTYQTPPSTSMLWYTGSWISFDHGRRNGYYINWGQWSWCSSLTQMLWFVRLREKRKFTSLPMPFIPYSHWVSFSSPVLSSMLHLYVSYTIVCLSLHVGSSQPRA